MWFTLGVDQAVFAQDEVLTGEAVALDVQPLGFFLRALGALIDVLLSIAVIVLLGLAGVWAISHGVLPSSMTGILTVIVVVLGTVVLPATVETATRGRSLGKLAVGGRIVRLDGGASGLRQALIRAAVGVLEIWMTAGAIAALTGAFTPRAQRLGDLVAGTASERTRIPKLPVGIPPLPPPLADWQRIADVGRLPDRLARRCAQFVRQAPAMAPAARLRQAQLLATEAAPFVSPIPSVDPETLVRGVVAVRRDRELHALLLQNERLAALTSGLSDR
jgi:uncharacterized RDD family membrane protein YckC